MAREPLAGHSLLITESSRSHSDTLHSVGLLWMNKQPDVETSDTTQHNTRQRQTSMHPAGFEPAIATSKHALTHVLNRVAIRIDLRASVVTKP